MHRIGNKLVKQDYCGPSIWYSIFGDNKAQLNLSHELFDYLLKDQYIDSQFKFIDPHNLLVFRLMHVYLLKNRINETNNNNAQIFEYYCQTHYYAQIAQSKWDYLEQHDFESWMTQQVDKEFNAFQNEIIKLENVLFQQMGVQRILQESELQMNQQEIIDGYNTMFRKTMFMNEVAADNLILNKVSKYYLAHRNYLKETSDLDLQKYKINWGLKDQLFIG